MRKTILLRDMDDDFVQMHMYEDHKDSVKYLSHELRNLVELRHCPLSDEKDDSTF